MKTANKLLVFILAVLLNACLFKLPYEYYEIIRFVLTASFIWLIINLKGIDNLGLKYFFGTLAILFNPFFKLKIGPDLYKIIDLIVSIVLYALLLKDIRIVKLFGATMKFLFSFFKKYIRKFITVLSVLFLAFLIGYFSIENKKAKEKIDMENVVKAREDSMFLVRHVDDSIKRVNDKIENLRLQELKDKLCNENEALKYFKEWFVFNHPLWKINGSPKIKKNEIDAIDLSFDQTICSFKISSIIHEVNPHYEYDETLIVAINLYNDGKFGQYQIKVIEKPVSF